MAKRKRQKNRQNNGEKKKDKRTKTIYKTYTNPTKKSSIISIAFSGLTHSVKVWHGLSIADTQPTHYVLRVQQL